MRTQIAAVGQGVLDSQNFWIEHKRDDAVKFNKDTLAKIDEFQKVVATDTVDGAAAAGGAQGNRRRVPLVPPGLPDDRRRQQLHPQARLAG